MRVRRRVPLLCMSITVVAVPACEVVFSDYDARFGVADSGIDSGVDASVDGAGDASADAPADADAALRPPSSCPPNMLSASPGYVRCPPPATPTACPTPPASSCCAGVPSGSPIPTTWSCASACPASSGITSYSPFACDTPDDCTTGPCCIDDGELFLTTAPPDASVHFGGCPVMATVNSPPPALPRCASTPMCGNNHFNVCSQQSDCPQNTPLGPTFCTPVDLGGKTFGLCLKGI